MTSAWIVTELELYDVPGGGALAPSEGELVLRRPIAAPPQLASRIAEISAAIVALNLMVSF
jgi:hypothetical protein